MSDPILVSEKMLRKWLEQFEIPAGIDDIANAVRGHQTIASSVELEEVFGSWLRHRVAVGFTGYRQHLPV